jgi:4-amino-4-deoxy-L-arabinose transferase-like glycosyltransferase
LGEGQLRLPLLLSAASIQSGVNTPNPALVTERGARALPRLALLLLCAAYVLPGVIGRDPWRNADLAAYGQMAAIASGRTSWWMPTLGGVAGDTGLLPHWLGAAFIGVLSPLVEPDLAARLPFALLLAAALALTWYATFHLARTDAALPLPFAFGGEADPVAYARAIADGAVLALMASLGLLQLGHETTPELAQLAATTLFLYALAAAPFRPWQARGAALIALPILAGSGAPSMALAMGVLGTVVCAQSSYPQVRSYAPWVAAAAVLAAVVAEVLGAWRWRSAGLTLDQLPGVARQWLWFMWPGWLFALWTLWRWRRHLLHRHLSVPLVGLAVALCANLVMGGSDRALMLGLPGLAILAALALPTFRRSTAAAVDWFSMLLFTGAAAFIWIMYIAMQTGFPAKPAANVQKLAQGFVPGFSWWPFALAIAGTLAWIWLVRWRTGRHREALWKSLVLPAGGVALCWLLTMTLLLPVLDFARSPRLWVQRIAAHVPQAAQGPGRACVAAPGATPSTVAALEAFGGWRVDARREARAAGAEACSTLIVVTRVRPLPGPPPGYERVAEVLRPAERDERTLIFRRIGAR